MVTSCCAYGCSYRFKKGDNIGLYKFPKDKNLRQLWIIAVRRKNWTPSPFSRICGKHFQTGKPVLNEDHPDYVPNVFVFDQNKTTKGKSAQWKAFQRELLNKTTKDVSVTDGYGWLKPKQEENCTPLVPGRGAELLHDTTKDVTVTDGYRWLKPKQEKNCTPLVPGRVAELLHDTTKDATVTYDYQWPKPKKNCTPARVYKKISREQLIIKPTKPLCSISNNTKENDAKKIKTIGVPSNGRRFIIQKEIKTSSSPRAWILNIPTKNNLVTPAEKAKESETETASVIPVKENYSALKTDSSAVSCNNTKSVSCNNPEPMFVESSIITSDDESTLTAESPVPAIEDIETSEATDQNVEPVKLEAIKNSPKSTINSSSTNTTDSDYSEFKSTPFDTKEILAIKLETMLAINISLKQKIKFYQHKCEDYEKEISDLRNIIKNLNLEN